MPKVTDDYINNKKNEILDATVAVLRDKPLYEITMLDVIKAAGLSKGGIYRYYGDIDDLLVEMINREATPYQYRESIDEVLRSNNSCEGTIQGLLMILGNHIDESPNIIGKIQFELTVLGANHPERGKRISSRLTENEDGFYLMTSLYQQISRGVEGGAFSPTISIAEIFAYIRVFIEGLVQVAVFEKCYSEGEGKGNISSKMMLAHLGDNLKHMLK